MKITYFGNSAFRVETGSSIILVDPFFTGNPAAKTGWQEASRGCTHLLLTHGHGDHTGDSLEILKETGALLVSNFEICMWLNAKGIDKYSPGNHGGRISFDDFDVIFTNAGDQSIHLVICITAQPARQAARGPGRETGLRPVSAFSIGDTRATLKLQGRRS